MLCYVMAYQLQAMWGMCMHDKRDHCMMVPSNVHSSQFTLCSCLRASAALEARHVEV